MAEGKEIVIRILNEKGVGSKKVDVTGDEQERVTNEFDTALLTAAIRKAYNQVKGMVVNEAKYQFELHYRMTDDYLGQQNMNIALGVVNKVWSAGTSMVSWAKIGGKIGGPMGAAIGVVVGAGFSAVSTFIQISHNYEQEHIKINQINANLDFNRQRAGYSLTAGSIGENK